MTETESEKEKITDPPIEHHAGHIILTGEGNE